MVFLVIGVLLAVGLFMLLSWWANTEVASAKRSLMWAIVAVCVLLGLVLYSRAGAISAMVPGAFALWRMTNIARTAASMANRFKGSNAQQGSGGGQMTRDEAYEVLGLEPGAPEEDINKAFKRLMAQCHPDKGGSDWMAAQLNEAKRTLLGK